MVVGLHLVAGLDVPYHVEVDSVAELEFAKIPLHNLVAYPARLMDQAIRKLRTAIHSAVQVGLSRLCRNIALN